MSSIVLPERFDFSYHTTFTEHYTKILAESSGGEITVDFAKVSYLDSSALGMLVLLNKRAAAKNRKVVISNARGTAMEVLRIANFEKVFEFK